jgi:hypothetical protein
VSIKIEAWQCDHCNRYRKTKGAITRHENICFNNPDREILIGQMAIFDTLPKDLLIWNSYGVEGSDWQEPDWKPSNELSEKYKWWPRDEDGDLALGFIYIDGWIKIEGYKPPTFSPGLCWEDEFIPANGVS